MDFRSWPCFICASVLKMCLIAHFHPKAASKVLNYLFLGIEITPFSTNNFHALRSPSKCQMSKEKSLTKGSLAQWKWTKMIIQRKFFMGSKFSGHNFGTVMGTKMADPRIWGSFQFRIRFQHDFLTCSMPTLKV